MATIAENITTIKTSIDRMKEALNLPSNTPLEDLTLAVEDGGGSGGGGSTEKSNIYKVKTTAERDAITDMVEGDMCVVIDSTIANMKADDTPSELTFPSTVVLPEAFNDFGYCSLRDSDNTVDVMIMMEQTSFRCDIMNGPNYVTVEYTSTDGITYTRTDTNGNPIVLGIAISCMYPEEWKDAFGYFLQVGGVNFSGIFTYSDNNWNYSKIGLSVLDRDLKNQIKAYSDSGVVEGVLFKPLNNETHINIENTLNSLVSDSTNATSLEGLYSAEIVGLNSNITSLLTLPYIRTANATSLKKMFYDQQKLTALDLSNFETSNVKDFSYMFYNNKALANLNIPSLNTSNGEHFDYMLYGCSSLATFDWTKLDTSKAKTMSNMFTYARSIGLPEALQYINTDSAIDISGLFKYNVSQKSWNISHLNTSNVENMAELFYGSGVTSVNMAGLDTSKVTNMQGMFWGHRLASLDLTGIDTSKVTDMSNMFDNDNGGSTSGFCIFDAITNLDFSSLENAQKMFYGEGRATASKSLNRKLSANFKTNKIKDMSFMFAVDGNDSVSYSFTFDVSNLDTSYAEDMRDMFYGYGETSSSKQGTWSKKIIGLGNFNTAKVKDMSYMFYGNYDVTSYDISGWDTSKVENMQGMFGYNKFITTLDLSCFTTESLKDIVGMFRGCTKLTRLDIRNMDFTNVEKYNNSFSDMNTSCLIIVKDETAKAFVKARNTALTNVKTVAEI
jgi:surface protein